MDSSAEKRRSRSDALGWFAQVLAGSVDVTWSIRGAGCLAGMGALFACVLTYRNYEKLSHRLLMQQEQRLRELCLRLEAAEARAHTKARGRCPREDMHTCDV